jgi:F-type H+-transporting ATPase subunit gamma
MMVERLAEVSAQIQNVRQLEAVVTALRGIAASRAQKARSLLAGIDAYSAVVSRAIGRALSLFPADFRPATGYGPGRMGIILFCAEQGFAGAFSERVLNDVGAADLANAMTIVIGTRGIAVASERGLTPSWSAPMASHVDAVPALANDIASALYAQIASSAPSTIEMLVPRSSSGGGIQIERHSLLPLEFARFAGSSETPPLTTLEPRELLERLTAEYVYTRLCDAAMHAYEAENQARMMAMTAARHNITSRLGALIQREQQLRQEEITNEIIELAAGTATLADVHRV